MEDIAGFPFFPVQYDKTGAAHVESEVASLLAFLAQATTTDLILMSHGWNNDMKEAMDLYRRLLASIRAELTATPTLVARNLAVVGILWPSKKFADTSLIAGGAASGESRADFVLKAQLDLLKDGFDHPDANRLLDRAKELVGRLQSSPKAQREFVDLLRSLVPRNENQPDVDGADSFFTEDGDTLMARLSRPVPKPLSRLHADEGGAASTNTEGGATGLFDSLGGIKDAALNLLNYTTYYQMKERAGLVGSVGVNALLRRVRSLHPNLKLHLIGHSFGGRLVTAAAAGKDEDPAQPVADTMTLLQAAFSHNGFAHHFDGDRDGFFRSLVEKGKVKGPILVTCTANDQAVGKLYPLASMFAGQDASAVGGPASRFGGIGCNGAQHTPEAVVGTLLDSNVPYEGERGLRPRTIHNLNSDAFISDHSDVCGREVAHAVLAAMATT